MNIAAAPSQLCAGIRIHAIDIVQPPGMAMPPDIERQRTMVPAALAMNRSADVARNARSLDIVRLPDRPFLIARIGRGGGPTPA
jgi:hypothetical protein